MKRNALLPLFFLFFQLFQLNQVFATNSAVTVNSKHLPHIEQLNTKDIIFRQYCTEVEQAYKIIAKKEKCMQNFYTYTATADDTLFTISSRCSIPYETIATLNSIRSQNQNLTQKKLLIPVAAGIFVNAQPELPYEQLLYAKNDARSFEKKEISCYIVNGKKFFFFQNERFTSAERAFFLDSSMKIPVKHAAISSTFGKRISPISGNWHFHSGIDFAAAEGEPVTACHSATVLSCTENDKIYGNFIILNHGGGLTSVYAHLSEILVKEGQAVYGGQKIGKIGHTGMATGPHLHFEIRKNTIPADPQKILEPSS